MVELSARPETWATDLSDRPAARRLARLQAETDDTVTTLRHQNLKLNRTARHVLRLLDGTRTRATSSATSSAASSKAPARSAARLNSAPPSGPSWPKTWKRIYGGSWRRG